MTQLIELARHRLDHRRRQLLAAQDSVGTRADAEALDRELKEVAAALARVDANTYGRCILCNAPIGRQRLLAVPEAAHCHTCEADLSGAGRTWNGAPDGPR